jgi:hypothetical protein
MSNTLEQGYKPVEAGREIVAEALAWMMANQTRLRNGLKSSLRAVLSGANRESSAWRALRAEYGPDEPITQAFYSDVMLVQMHNYLDH